MSSKTYLSGTYVQVAHACNRWAERWVAEHMPTVELDHWPPHLWDRQVHGQSAVFRPSPDVLAALNEEGA